MIVGLGKVALAALIAALGASAHTGAGTGGSFISNSHGLTKVSTSHVSHGLTKGSTSYVLPALSQSAPTTGAVGQVWAEAELAALAAPETSANITTMEDWFFNEGNNPVHGENNPLNSNVRYGGSTSFGPEDDQNYLTPADGISGMANQFITTAGGSQSYTAILAGLRSGKGLLGQQSSTVESELRVYSGGGYDSIPASYCGGSPTCGEGNQ